MSSSANSQNIKVSQQAKLLPGLNVRRCAALGLDHVLKGVAFSPLTADTIDDARDRALSNRLITTAIRRHGHLNLVLEKLLKRGMPKRSGLFEAILRIGLVQLLFLPEMGEHSAVHLAVETAKQDRRSARFGGVLNGVLRQAQREKQHWQNLDVQSLFPEWLRTEWQKDFGEQALLKFGDALLTGAPLDVVIKDEGDDLLDALNGERIIFDSLRIELRDKSVDQMPFFKEGRWWVQDVAAAIAARLFKIAPFAEPGTSRPA